MCKNPNLHGRPEACATSIKVARHIVSAYADLTGLTYDKALERLAGVFKVEHGISLEHIARRQRMDVLSAAALRPDVMTKFTDLALAIVGFLAVEVHA
jgi:hypothetical protein